MIRVISTGSKRAFSWKRTARFSIFAVLSVFLNVFCGGMLFFDSAQAVVGTDRLPQQWSSGTFDRAQLRRGFQVYSEVCSSCHTMSLLSFRDLVQPGGPEFSLEMVEEFAAAVTIDDGPGDVGDMFARPGLPSDRFPSPFSNKQAASTANNGSYPPDLSLIAKARLGGENYLYSLLVGYEEPPAHIEKSGHAYYNVEFSGSWIAMPPPLSDLMVKYSDGTPGIVDQYARDVAAFLTWAAEPHLEERIRIGKGVLIFMITLAGLLFILKKQLWDRLN